jgi:hypothetical protein
MKLAKKLLQNENISAKADKLQAKHNDLHDDVKQLAEEVIEEMSWYDIMIKKVTEMKKLAIELDKLMASK